VGLFGRSVGLTIQVSAIISSSAVLFSLTFALGAPGRRKRPASGPSGLPAPPSLLLFAGLFTLQG
jgi:hypothetical protein